jgi:hypothetical protein
MDATAGGANEQDKSGALAPMTATKVKVKKPERQRGFLYAEEGLPLFVALESAYPGPLSSTSGSEESDGDEEGLSMRRRRRRSSDGKDGATPESVTTAPSTESVQALLGAESRILIEKPAEPSTSAPPRRPVPSRRV